jgi:hypothetical protein
VLSNFCFLVRLVSSIHEKHYRRALAASSKEKKEQTQQMQQIMITAWAYSKR